MARAEHLKVVRHGAEAIAEWRTANPGAQLELPRADLSDLSLQDADLSKANLTRADLTGADLKRARLTRADLTRADLTMTDLSNASLRGVNLYRASFTAAHLAGVDFSNARFGFTCISDCDLCKAKGLGKTKHEIPSSVGLDTLARTLRGNNGRFSREQSQFFRAAGVPNDILSALPRILKDLKHYSCFIAYGGPDEEFAADLSKRLSAKGVETWFFPRDATVGEPSIEEERRARRNADKVVVICSVGGLSHPGVLREIDETGQEDPRRLVSILRDDGWRNPAYRVERDGRDLKHYLTKNVWADFANDSSAFTRLLKSMEKPRR